MIFVGVVPKAGGGYTILTRASNSTEIIKTEVTQEMGEIILTAQRQARNQIRQQLQRILREE
jgi:hypothetical protein